MLRALTVAATALAIAFMPLDAFADSAGCNYLTKTCDVVGGGGGGGGTAPGPQRPVDGGTSRGGGPRVCMLGGSEVPCTSPYGTWIDAYGMWCNPMDPQPPKDDPAWGGKTEGAIYSCLRPAGSGVQDSGMVFTSWLPAGVEEPPPNPEDLAWEAIASVGIEPIDPGIAPQPLSQNPESLGAVGLPVWLWSDSTAANQVGPVSASASERGYTVTIQGRVDRIEWDFGDGGPGASCGQGQRFNPDTMGPETPVVCGRQEGYSKQGEYTITATSHWVVDWAGINQTGTIEFPRTVSETVRIGEIQVVTTGS